jgi:hypothetical protein
MARKGILMISAAAAALLLLAAACDDEPTQQEAEDQFCDDAGEFLAALGALRDVDKDTTVDEFDQLRENARTSYDNMIASAEELRYSRLSELEDAKSGLDQAIDDIDDDATLQEARASIEEEVDNVALEVSQALNDVDCGSGQGAQERSDE